VDVSPSLSPEVKQRLRARHGRRITLAGELVITSQRYRDQERNKADCLEKLRELLAEVATPPRKRRKTRPTRGSQERRLKGKREASQKKQQRRSTGWE
jgi:ribosome-associated protein